MRKIFFDRLVFVFFFHLMSAGLAAASPLRGTDNPTDVWSGKTRTVHEERLRPVDHTSMEIYVINLDRAPERLGRIKGQMAAHGLAFRRFEAVDGRKLLFSDSAKKKISGLQLQSGSFTFIDKKAYSLYCPSGPLRYHAARFVDPNKTDFLTAGELGVYCSQVGVWRDIVANNRQESLILEDDIMLGVHFGEQVKQVLHHLPKDWDLIFAYVQPGDQNGNERYRNDLLNIKNNPILLKIAPGGGGIASAAAYYLSVSGAKKLLSIAQDFSEPVDTVISEAIKGGMINAYRVFERNAFTIREQSYIYDMGRLNQF